MKTIVFDAETEARMHVESLGYDDGHRTELQRILIGIGTQLSAQAKRSAETYARYNDSISKDRCIRDTKILDAFSKFMDGSYMR